MRIGRAVGGVTLALLLLGHSQAVAAGACPNEQLRLEDRSRALPDCRAYEQVTPAGPYDTAFNALSPDGGTVFYASGGAIDGLPPDTNNDRFYWRMFGDSRLASGWELSSETSFVAEEVHVTYLFMGASPDGRQMFVVPQLSPLNLYLAGADGSPAALISHDEDGNPSAGLLGPVVVSADGTHVVFSSVSPLTQAAAASGGGPYVYEADAAGRVSLVSVMSGGQPPRGGASAGVGSARPGAPVAGAIVANALSADGSTVFFSSSGPYDPAAPDTGTQVFMHRSASTIDVSRSQTQAPGTSGAAFDGASSTGDEVVFSDQDQLTADAPATGAPQLYEYDSRTGRLGLVSRGDAEGLGDGAGGATFLAMSADGSHVFFASADRLDPSAPASAPGVTFLYESAGGHVTYVATLSDVGFTDLQRLQSRSAAEGAELAAYSLGPIRTTPDGRYLVFESERPLTPDVHNSEAGRVNVYEYTDGQGLVRVSQGSLPGAGNGPYDATIGSQQQLPDFAPNQEGVPFTYGASQRDGRVLSDDGSVFFSSREALAEGATDGPLHVYEFRQGRTYLISPAGAGASDARYLESSPDGSDVYFSSTQEVLSSDTNGGWVNTWDARVDGGFPGPPAASRCAENECPVPAPPPRPVPLSALFAGLGNAPAPTTRSRARKRSRTPRACRGRRTRRERRRCYRKARRR